MTDNLPKPTGRGFKLGDDERNGGGGVAPDRFEDMEYWEGTISRRLVAYLVDLAVLCAIWFALGAIGLLSLGLLSPVTALAWALAPLAYHTLTVSQFGATIGQRTMGLTVCDPETGTRPTLLQALLLTILFYFSITVLAFVPLLYCLFDDRDRLLHDLLSRTRTVRSDAFG